MTITVYIDPRDKEHRTLPARWESTSPVTEAWALAHGWIKESRTIPDPPEIHQYSKLHLYDALLSAGIWDQVRSAIEQAGQLERWNLAVDLSTDYAPFAAILSQLRQTYGDELVDSILSQAEI